MLGQAAACTAVLAIGCGRIGFEEPGDPSGHDEDGDGVPDVVDVCPHIADPAQRDADGDRVGDACDIEPNAARQSILWFSPMTELDSRFATMGTWSPEGDDIVSDLSVAELRATLPAGGDV